MKDKKKYNIVVNLSEEDFMELCEKAFANEVTVSNVVESFINDLLRNNESNGSDECRYIEDWFWRCFAMYVD